MKNLTNIPSSEKFQLFTPQAERHQEEKERAHLPISHEKAYQD